MMDRIITILRKIVLPRDRKIKNTHFMLCYYNRRLFIIWILAITLLGMGLRYYRISNQSLWTDEIYTITTARAPLDQIVAQSAELNNSLPTYFLVLRTLVGESDQSIEFRARALMGTLSIPLFIGCVYLWRQHLGTALLSGFLLAINPLHLWYSQEARAYATMLFLGLLTLISYELAQEYRKVKWWVLYFLSAVSAVAFHKTGLIFPIACGFWHLSMVIRNRGRIRNLLVHAATILGIAIFVLMQKAHPPQDFQRHFSFLEIAYTAMTFLGGYSFGPSLTDIQTYGAFAAVSQNLIQVVLLSAVILLIIVVFALNIRFLIYTKEIALLFFTIGLAAFGGRISGFSYNVRYVLPALFGFLALFAVAFAKSCKPYVSRLAVSCVLLIALLAFWADWQWFYSSHYRKGDSRAVAKWLFENKERVESWTVIPDYLSASIEWYLQPNPEILANAQHVEKFCITSFSPVPDVLIIGRRHHIVDPERLIAQYRNVAGEVRIIKTIAGFELYVRETHRPITLQSFKHPEHIKETRF